MPQIRCAACHAPMMVRTSLMGGEVECPTCGKVFVAGGAHGPHGSHGPRHSHGAHEVKDSSTKVILASIGGGVLLAIGAWFMLRDGDDKENDAAALAARAAAETPKETAPPKPAFTATQADLEQRADAVAKAIETGDSLALSTLVSWPTMHDRHAPFDEPDKCTWALLTSDRQKSSRKRLSDSILGKGDGGGGDFFSHAQRAKLVARVAGSGFGNAEITHQDTQDEYVSQRRTVDFVEEAGVWYVADVKTETLTDPRKAFKAAAAARVETVEKCLAVMVRQEQRPGVAADVNERVDGLMKKLTDLSLTTEQRVARKELVAIGKPAVPALLNAIVDRVELKTNNQRIEVNLVVQALKEISGVDTYFLTDPDAGVGGPKYLDNLKLLRSWWDWWGKQPS